MSTESQPRALITPADLVGFEIDGRYRLDAIVGGGGMGVVYRTTQHNLNRDIAIKVLKLDDVDGKGRLERFKREIDIIAQLSHPNIVRVFDTGCDPVLGLHYIAMELVEGGSLDEVMRGRCMKPELAIDIAYEVAAALTEPHKLGIVHRDIKPANVLLTVRSDDTIGVKVVDFGIARGQTASHSKITTTGVVVGSPMYMAPEVARGETLDGRTDIYSLGVLMYEMLTGDTPFRGSTPVAIMLRHAVEEPPSLAEAVEDDFQVPELIELVDRMLSKEKDQRPKDAKTVMRTLQEIRGVHQMRRVEVDGGKGITAALSGHLRPVRVPKGVELDPFAPTTPIDASAAQSESFHGWLVTDSARAALEGTDPGADDVEGPDERDESSPARRSKAGPALIAASVGLIGVGFAVWGFGGIDRPVEDAPTELGTTPVAEPQVIEEPLAAAPAEPEVEQPDLGSAEVHDAGVVAKADVATPDSPQPATVKKQRRTVKKTAEDDEFKKGMEWLHKK